ncbi:MAG: hypothetical protein BWY26_00045 [Elusimicrobia bacterium ADurb.Bin231]|jgi:hypothetical protein|nr:MAG: hypothetical protein BWY26_00611 [Elusimicrobia bacterium ADurb.Bin231]OQA92782.1 MAG: hypothetical protein BWY26_00054 [Elusimicrobia bacterium ADurb.Bin231]OQA92796.1 MAG: hypothetical protein BWY26_00045 [Elusimicrobia bacterium ADurb.Bin231]
MSRREKKKYHFLYKTTNLLNGKFYIGVHSTDNLDDGYLGSGRILRYSIRKYGIENFKIERLEFFEDKEKLFKREKEMVNESFLKNPLCMNIMIGGKGGNNGKGEKWYKEHINLMLQAQWKDPKFIEEHKKRCSKNLKGSPNSSRFKGKKHSDETILQMRNTHHLNGDQKGTKNSQFGTCWIHNDKENKKIKKSDIDLYPGWVQGRKMKFQEIT